MVDSPRLQLRGDMDERIKQQFTSLIDSINGNAQARLVYTSGADDGDLAVRTNITNLINSVNEGYPRRLQLSGSVKNLTLRTNLTNIIVAHNSKVGKNAKGK